METTAATIDAVPTMYWALFGVLAVVCVVAVQHSEQGPDVVVSAEFRRFRRNFLTVWFLASGADWMQGPYNYPLYRSYGFSYPTIAMLFLVAFVSSMVFGTVVASLADKCGRKANCIAFGIVYSCSCAATHFPSLPVLVLGRVFAGIATSILTCVFETWMVHEHKQRAFDDEWLSSTFSLMTLVSGSAAICSALVASMLVSTFGTPVAPFDASIVLLTIVSIVVACTWGENYGGGSSSQWGNFASACHVIYHNQKVLLVGIVQAFFEGAMFIFVFQWAPALEHVVQGVPPHGIAFASFMVCLMLGSSVFKTLNAKHSVESLLPFVLAMAAVSLALPIAATALFDRTQTAYAQGIIMLSFCAFECCVGFYFPAIGTLRGRHLQEETRSTTMNLIRVALNLIVVAVLLNAKTLGVQAALGICALCHCVSLLAMIRLARISDESASSFHHHAHATPKPTPQPKKPQQKAQPKPT